MTSTIARRTRQLGIRPLLIRRPGRATSVGMTVMAAFVHPTRSWLERTVVASADELLDLELAPLGEGRSLGLTPTTEPTFLVCTHGRHDVCCAEKGRPIAAALAVHEPAATWEVSHIGGDRFAGNVLVLPDGLYYGRLDPSTVVSMAAAHRAGQISLAHLRGRSSQPFDVQAADWYLRDRLGLTGLRDFTWVGRHVDHDQVQVEFVLSNRDRWTVVVRPGHAPAAELTCSSNQESAAPTFEVVRADIVSPAG